MSNAVTADVQRTVGQCHEVVKRILRGSLDPELVRPVLQCIIERRRVIELEDAVQGLSEPFLVTIAEQDFESQVGAGRYERINRDYEDLNWRDWGGRSLELEETVDRELFLFNFKHLASDRLLTTEELLRSLSDNGLVPVDIRTLLSFGEHHPNIQRSFPITTPGSYNPPIGYWSNPRCVAVLDMFEGKQRLLDFALLDKAWHPDYRILVSLA